MIQYASPSNLNLKNSVEKTINSGSDLAERLYDSDCFNIQLAYQGSQSSDLQMGIECFGAKEILAAGGSEFLKQRYSKEMGGSDMDGKQLTLTFDMSQI